MIVTPTFAPLTRNGRFSILAVFYDTKCTSEAQITPWSRHGHTSLQGASRLPQEVTVWGLTLESSESSLEALWGTLLGSPGSLVALWGSRGMGGVLEGKVCKTIMFF